MDLRLDWGGWITFDTSRQTEFLIVLEITLHQEALLFATADAGKGDCQSDEDSFPAHHGLPRLPVPCTQPPGEWSVGARPGTRVLTLCANRRKIGKAKGYIGS